MVREVQVRDLAKFMLNECEPKNKWLIPVAHRKALHEWFEKHFPNVQKKSVYLEQGPTPEPEVSFPVIMCVYCNGGAPARKVYDGEPDHPCEAGSTYKGQ